MVHKYGTVDGDVEGRLSGLNATVRPQREITRDRPGGAGNTRKVLFDASRTISGNIRR
jgi:hypothetical protein